MKKTGFLFDERYLLHDTGSYHPEAPARLQAVYQGIKEAELLSSLTLIHASLPDLKWIEAVHDKEYIKRFEMACLSGNSTFDCPDNQICQATYETALLAVGGILDATSLVMNAEIDNAFCAVRPPGHHAEINKAMGFCYFNNVAIAARYLQKEWGIKRVGIADFDVHHGNGTQGIFYDRDDVLTVSIHADPVRFYPFFWGHADERGTGRGTGYNLNLPLARGTGDDAYLKTLDVALERVVNFGADVVVVALGLDAYENDPLRGLAITTPGFGRIGAAIARLGMPTLFVQEGGYLCEELGQNLTSVLTGFEEA